MDSAAQGPLQAYAATNRPRVAGARMLSMPVLLAAALIASAAGAEPYLAVQNGLKCAACHTNPSGGGKRNAFGNAYAAGQLAARIVGEAGNNWTGEISRWLAVGGDLRAGYEAIDVPNNDEQSQFDVSRGTLYGEFRAIPGLLSIYVDEQLAPDNAFNREAYALITPAAGRYTIKVGKFFLPFGWRLQDDSAFTRQFTGINFNTPDTGIEGGLELGSWSMQAAITNGTAGGPENDSTKQISLRAAHVSSRWRFGASFNFNNSALGDRTMAGVFAGLRTGPISWLAEVDVITDETPTGDTDMTVGLIEGNWQFAKGHILKVTYEAFDPNDDIDEDHRERYSVFWEHSPMQMLQPRIGVRIYNGIPQSDPQNREELFAELHAFF